MKQFITEAKRMQKLAGILKENTESYLNEGMTKEDIISILKKYEKPNSPFYKSNFSDYITDFLYYSFTSLYFNVMLGSSKLWDLGSSKLLTGVMTFSNPIKE